MPLFQKPRRPDHLTRHACPPQHQRHRRPLGGRLQADRFQPRAHLSRRPQTGHQPLVQHAAQRPADGLPDAPAQSLAQSSQYGLRHAVSSRFQNMRSGQVKAAARFFSHQSPIQLSITDRPQ